MAFWNEQGKAIKPFETYLPKTINEKFNEKEIIELATQGQSLWSGIAKISKVDVSTENYGQGGMDTYYKTTVQLELDGKDGKDIYTLEYGNKYYPGVTFTEGTNIAFIGTKEQDKLDVIMFGEPADLEVIQSKLKGAIENGQAVIKLNKLKEKLQIADALVVKPLKAGFAELKENWENIKRERKAKEQAKIEEAKVEREVKNNRPTGYYSQPEEQIKNNDISK